MIYSVVGTCRLLGVNPEAYLLWVLPKRAAATKKTAVNLLPHDFARLHPQTEKIKDCESSPFVLIDCAMKQSRCANS